MQNITQKCSTQRKDQISCLPIIDLNPSDENCIYSILLYICDQGKKLRVEVPSVTFYQPFWQRSVGTIARANLRRLFIEVNAENTVSHIMSGKAVSRSLRSHFLTEAVLITLLLEQVFDSDMIETKRFEGKLTEALKTVIQQTKKHFLKQNQADMSIATWKN